MQESPASQPGFFFQRQQDAKRPLYRSKRYSGPRQGRFTHPDPGEAEAPLTQFDTKMPLAETLPCSPYWSRNLPTN